MPYIHAIIKVKIAPPFYDLLCASPHCYRDMQEIERVHNPFWLGTPHMNTKDFYYHGYLIPKETVVIMNSVRIPDRSGVE